jgi:hypothetical protein
MTTPSRFIAAALIAAAALAPGLASADDRHGWRERGDREEDPGCHDHASRFQPVQPAPSWATREDLRWDGRGWIRAGWGRGEQGGRFEQARAVRHELLLLEAERAEFHARFAGHPRRVARFDAQYVQRRDELERRLQRVTRYAWR